jgi:hypothetical protein
MDLPNMSYDPRTIAYQADILHPPIPLRPDAVQGIHNALFRQPAFAYQNFQVAPDGIHLTNLPQAPGQVSAVTFLPDRMVLREEFRSTTIEDFASRVVNVVRIGFQTLGVPVALAQQFIVRSLIQPRHLRENRETLTQRMLGTDQEAWQGFGRPLHSAGLRLQFAPTQEQRESFHVRIETWHQDPRSVWIENTGSFAQPTVAENLPQLGEHLYATYRFMTGPVGEFLSCFDLP